MSRSIAAKGRLPFGYSGINISAALTKDGTEMVNLKIHKQRSDSVFDLVDPSTGIIYTYMTAVTTDKNKNTLDINKTDLQLLKLISKGQFFIRIKNQNGSTLGFWTKFLENMVHTNNGTLYLDPDRKYSDLYNNDPQPRHVVDGTTGMQTVFHKPDGSAYVGTGIPTTELIVSTDGLIELALGIRYWRTTTGYPTLITPINNVYTKNLETTGDWTIPFSIGMKVSNNVGFITDYYDVTMTFYGKNDGSESEDHKLSFALQTVNGMYQMVPDIVGIGPIVDSYIDPDKRFLQNSSRYKFYSGSFVDPSVPNGQTPLGKYKLKLVAIHKATGLITKAECWADITRN